MSKAIHNVVAMPNSQVGAHMYSQGFGTWQAKLGGEVHKAVVEAVKAGYRLIDCARIYRNQEEIGTAIKEVISQGLVQRKDLFIVSKVWNTDHAPADVVASTRRTLRSLQCEYLDLLLIHWPVSWQHHPDVIEKDDPALLFPKNEQTGGTFQADVPITKTWEAMESLVKEGLVKDIGLSNFEPSEIDNILAHCTVKPAALQIEVHPGLPQHELRDYCAKKGIAVMAYCPLGIGMDDPNVKGLLHNKELQAIAKEALGSEDKLARLLLQWSAQSGLVCLSKSVRPERIADNAATPASGLSEETMKKLEEFGKKLKPNELRCVNPSFFHESKRHHWAK